jgi:xylulokinase
MHGLVLVDKAQQILRNSIIWCDSRAVEIGEKALCDIGEKKCLIHLLNSPGNFTASKLAWVQKNEPSIYEKINKVMLPGDFIAMKFTGECTTTSSALSEGIFWDFQKNRISEDVLNYFGFDIDIFPAIQPVFSTHGFLKEKVAGDLGLTAGIPVSYKAGDQLNNALSLNVLNPGEIAATAGTSGVIYGVSDKLEYDPQSRINSFAHVNHHADDSRIGILLCINGAGIFNRWTKNIAGTNITYHNFNEGAAKIDIGSNGLMALPFGNGAERMLENKMVGAHFHNIDFNIHTTAHIVRAVQEGIAFAFRYGLDIMRENGIDPNVIRASRANLFLSEVFTQSFVNSTNVEVQFYGGDGSFGAAIGAGIGAGFYKDPPTAFCNRKPVGTVSPDNQVIYDNLYEKWKELLKERLKIQKNKN